MRSRDLGEDGGGRQEVYADRKALLWCRVRNHSGSPNAMQAGAVVYCMCRRAYLSQSSLGGLENIWRRIFAKALVEVEVSCLVFSDCLGSTSTKLT